MKKGIVRRGETLLDYDEVQIRPEGAAGHFVLTVIGYTRHAPVEVRLSPQTYVRRPKYWKIKVLGKSPKIVLEVLTTYTATLALARCTGTKGIEIIGIARSERKLVPPRAAKRTTRRANTK
jgi:hypothetical protein